MNLTNKTIMTDVIRHRLVSIATNIEWYDRVYLCYEDVETPNTYSQIKGFICYKFNSFTQADKTFSLWCEKNNEKRHTMIPICKWVPNIFDKYILNYKLKNMYWLGKNKIYHNTKRV